MLKTVSTANGLVSPTFSGDVTLSNGNLVIGTSGQGIDFSATPGTGTSELLADYEEGTWTPTFTNFTLGGAQTIVTATYTKVGRFVYLQTTFQNATSITSAGGNSFIANLPHAPTFSGTAQFCNENTGASIGIGDVYAANGRLYPPSFVSGANEVIVMTAIYVA